MFLKNQFVNLIKKMIYKILNYKKYCVFPNNIKEK